MEGEKESTPNSVTLRGLTLEANRVICMLGDNDVGPAALLRYLTSSMDFAEVVVISIPHEGKDRTDYWKQLLPGAKMRRTFFDDKEYRSLVETGERDQRCVVLDDCVQYVDINQSLPMKGLHYEGRHCGLTLVNIVSKIPESGIPRCLRLMVDYVVYAPTIASLQDEDQLQRVAAAFFPSFQFAELKQILEGVVDEGGDLFMMDMTSQKPLADCLYWHKERLD